MHEDFRSRLLDGETLIGTMITLPCPAVSEMISLLNYDWLFIDGEHGAIDTGDLRQILPAAEPNAACLVRVPSHDEVAIKRALDLGATGIIVPKVNTRAQAEAIVEHCRYPDREGNGGRGIGLARAHGYGLKFEGYTANANEQVVVVIQAEHRLAVENIEEIVSVPGIDCVFIGPADLSASYGKTGQTDDPEVVMAMQRICDVCLAGKIPIGVFDVGTEFLKPWMEKGCSLIGVGIDSLMLTQAASQLRDEL